MALTKHQKLAKELKTLLADLDAFYHKVAAQLDILQFHFFEKYTLVGRPKMSTTTLQTMMKTHRCGLKLFSPNEELRSACRSKPLLGAILSPPLIAASKIRIREPDSPEHARWVVPWGVRISIPDQTTKSLEGARNEALLYCASAEEMPEWIDWFEKEDQATTFTNQLLSILSKTEEKTLPFRAEDIKPRPARWKTGFAVDRQTYSAFLQYFFQRFLDNPLVRRVEGEIALLIWIMMYVGQTSEQNLPIRHLLQLTTANVKGRFLTVDHNEIELSMGLAYLLQAYIGKIPAKRQQKLFPNLSIDKLEDHFHRASKLLLPPGSIPVLPEAFLTFPHSLPHIRMHPECRKKSQSRLPEAYHASPSRRDIIKQLKQISKQHAS